MPIVLTTPQLLTNTATSGTIGNTIVDTATIIEHAFRRVKVHPSQQTPETIAIAKNNLYMTMLNMANRGLNLWCVQTDLIGLEAGRAVYDMTVGSIDVLNVIYTQTVRATGTDTTTINSFVTELASATKILRIGLKFTNTYATNSLLLEWSNDGISWTTITALVRSDFEVGEWYWITPSVIPEGMYFRVTGSTAIVVDEFFLASGVMDMPVIQWNRDTWSTIPNKFQQGKPSTNYYLERLLTPRITLWPVPNNDYDFLQIFVQREAQDVGSLNQSIEVPQRWKEAIIWQLALRLAFELPQVDPNLIQSVKAMADETLLEVEREETDGASMTIQPRISVYTR